MADLVRPDAPAPQIAAWDQPLADPNLQDAQITHTLGALANVPVLGRVEAAYRQKFRLKSWQYMTAVSDELFVAFVVGTAGFASNGFVYAVELATGKVHQRFAITPLTVGTRVAPSSVEGQHRFQARGLGVTIDNRARSFTAKLDATTIDDTRLVGELELASRPRDEHLALCVPLPGGRWNYTHKFASFAVTGHVTIGGRRFAFAPERAFGTMDFTKMYALRHAVWRWVALCGRSRQGALIGLNMVDPTPDAPVSENAAWIDGKREPLAAVRLSLDAPDLADSAWRVEARSVDLRMQAIAHVEQKLDLPLVKQKLRHVVGSFSGHVRTRTGHVHDLESVVGIAEDYDTWW
ncbi:MAG TPA: DUF2804 domain-containing protein [Kofleriaceae bacterium]|nr:DUF2804 domain-containing protein [Kofleriaceae bacterium]